MDWSRIEPWDYMVVTVAAEYHKKYSMIELADIKQTLYEWFPLHKNNFNEWEKLDPREMKNLMYRSLRNYALDYCQKWKAEILGYDVSDLYYYEPEVVEALLPFVLSGDWSTTHKLNLGRPGKPSAPNEGGNLQAMLIEIDSAYHKLNKDERHLLFLRYAEFKEHAEIASELELPSPDAARMRTTRAVRKLVLKMGGYRPFLDKDRPDNVTDKPDELVSQEDSTDSNEYGEDSADRVE